MTYIWISYIYIWLTSTRSIRISGHSFPLTKLLIQQFVDKFPLWEIRYQLKGPCALRKHETRLTKAGGKIWDNLSLRPLPPLQHYMIQKRSVSIQLNVRERKDWLICTVPQFFWQGSPEGWLLSCQSWSSNMTTRVYPPREEWRCKLGLVDSIDSPLCSAQRE